MLHLDLQDVLGDLAEIERQGSAAEAAARPRLQTIHLHPAIEMHPPLADHQQTSKFRLPASLSCRTPVHF